MTQWLNKQRFLSCRVSKVGLLRFHPMLSEIWSDTVAEEQVLWTLCCSSDPSVWTWYSCHFYAHFIGRKNHMIMTAFNSLGMCGYCTRTGTRRKGVEWRWVEMQSTTFSSSKWRSLGTMMLSTLSEVTHGVSYQTRIQTRAFWLPKHDIIVVSYMTKMRCPAKMWLNVSRSSGTEKT